MKKHKNTTGNEKNNNVKKLSVIVNQEKISNEKLDLNANKNNASPNLEAISIYSKDIFISRLKTNLKDAKQHLTRMTESMKMLLETEFESNNSEFDLEKYYNRLLTSKNAIVHVGHFVYKLHSTQLNSEKEKTYQDIKQAESELLTKSIDMLEKIMQEYEEIKLKMDSMNIDPAKKYSYGYDTFFSRFKGRLTNIKSHLREIAFNKKMLSYHEKPLRKPGLAINTEDLLNSSDPVSYIGQALVNLSSAKREIEEIRRYKSKEQKEVGGIFKDIEELEFLLQEHDEDSI